MFSWCLSGTHSKPCEEIWLEPLVRLLSCSHSESVFLGLEDIHTAYSQLQEFEASLVDTPLGSPFQTLSVSCVKCNSELHHHPKKKVLQIIQPPTSWGLTLIGDTHLTILNLGHVVNWQDLQKGAPLRCFGSFLNTTHPRSLSASGGWLWPGVGEA